MFESNPNSKALPLPVHATLSLSTESIDWEECGAEGFYIKALFEDQNSAQKTWLMKVDPGAYSPEHTHDELEQIYVLQGSFYDSAQQYKTGDYAIRSAGFPHDAGSEDGALVLLFYSKA